MYKLINIWRFILRPIQNILIYSLEKTGLLKEFVRHLNSQRVIKWRLEN